MTLLRNAFLLMVFLFGINAAYAVNVAPTNNEISSEITVGEFIDFKIKDYQELTGEKLKLKDKIEFLAVKRVLKKQVKKGVIAEEAQLPRDRFVLDWVGFLLGFFLGLLGIIVALIIKKKRPNVAKSAGIGLGVWFLLVILTVIL